MKSSSTWVIPASLYEGLFFYFYVESSSSYIMHQLGEHNCHSEYNVPGPKIYYWVEYDYDIACSKIICIYSPLKLWRCSSIYVLLFHEGQARYHFTMILLWSNKRITFNASLRIVNYLCYFSCCNVVAKFTLLELYLSCFV